MNTLDIVICVIVGFCFVRGIFRGIIREFTSIVGVFAGLYTAHNYYDRVADTLSLLMSNVGYRNILAFLFIFCSTLVVISLIGVLLKYILKASFIGWVDRLTGSLFGVTKGILIVSVLMVALTSFLPKQSPVIKESTLAPYVSRISDELMAIVPTDDLYRYFNENLEALKKAWTQ